MEIKISIEKKYVWLLILVISAVGIVVAYGSNNPPVMGHTIGEVDGVDQKVIDVMNTQAATYLSGKQLIEGRRYTYGSQDTIFTPSAPFQISSLAQYTNIYTGNNDRGGFQGYKGCLRAITAYCQTQGYELTSVQSTTCGAAFAGDTSCPDVPGCSITFYCLKEK
ncbi:hypothetical protein J4208_00315 [Candidatus Woesearchaeota archaeon]|nr:hypothetical protein [Candidatus Woesearchaeota archaeon]